MGRSFVAIGIAALVAACGRDTGVPFVGRGPKSPAAGAPVPTEGVGTGLGTACADLFAQDRLNTYRVEISADEWAKLEDEFLHRAERVAAGLDPHPWHPIVFRLEDEVVSTAMIRLKGDSSWDLAVLLDPDPKMQFVVSFNELDRRGRFHGLRKIVLDMPRNDRTFLRQRLALSVLRDLGLPAQCANNARLEINGAYYGLYTSMEAMDREFLRRSFPGEDGGDLWERGRELKTNEETSTRVRIAEWAAVRSLEEMLSLVDAAASLRTWAAEAMLPDSDGYFGGRHNFYLYDHPARGFVWLSHDLDGTFDVRPFALDPFLWSRAEQPGLHYLFLLSRPEWMGRYVAALEDALAGYDVATLDRRTADWAAQIAEAAATDPHRPFSLAIHVEHLANLRAFFAKRASFVREWIDCRRGGGEDPDGDGAAWCLDCAEGDPKVRPGAAEVCGNALDDDCDGWVDQGC